MVFLGGGAMGVIKRVGVLVGLVLGLFACSYCAYGQGTGATLTGTVIDSSGAVIPGATVLIKNTATGETRNLAADQAGLYSAPNLPPGTYDVTVSARGFSTQVVNGVVLEVGASQALSATLTVGQVAQTVTVAGEAPDVQTTTSSVSNEVTQQTIVDLPLNGRDWSSLAALEPGVISIRAQLSNTTSNLRANRGFGNALSDSGHRPNENNYGWNGISLMDHANSPPTNSIGDTLGVDAIQEFNVVTTSYSAETGRATGASINVNEKSGTNQFHGSAFEFLRNAALDARNYFDAPVIPPFRRNQFGGSIGGPIKKDKTFFFFNYEGIRMYQSVTEDDTVPTAAARAGHLCSVPTTGTCTPNTVTVSPAATEYLPFWPLPNAGLVGTSNGDIGFWKGAGFNKVSDNFFTARGDHKFSDKDSLTASWIKETSPFEFTDALVDEWNDSNEIRNVGTIQETHIFSASLLNTARFGYSQSHAIGGLPGGAIIPLAANTTIGYLPGVSPAQLSVSGITTELSGLGSYGHYEHPWESFQFYDDLFLTRGTHSLKFGFATERMHDDDYNHPLPGAFFSFTSLQNFLVNIPNSALGSLPTIHSVHIRQTLFAGYVQDDWQFRRNLTLNLGLRYEMTTIPNVTTNNLLLHPNLSSGLAVPAGQMWNRNATLHNFDPRIGFAWVPFNNGKTAVRGAFGIYDALPLSYGYSDELASDIPFAQWASVNLIGKPGTFPTGGLTLATFVPNNEMSSYIEPDPSRSYVMNWNLNVEQSFSPNTTLRVSFLGSRGVRLPDLLLNVNWVLPVAQVDAGGGISGQNR